MMTPKRKQKTPTTIFFFVPLPLPPSPFPALSLLLYPSFTLPNPQRTIPSIVYMSILLSDL